MKKLTHCKKDQNSLLLFTLGTLCLGHAWQLLSAQRENAQTNSPANLTTQAPEAATKETVHDVEISNGIAGWTLTVQYVAPGGIIVHQDIPAGTNSTTTIKAIKPLITYNLNKEGHATKDVTKDATDGKLSLTEDNSQVKELLAPLLHPLPPAPLIQQNPAQNPAMGAPQHQ